MTRIDELQKKYPNLPREFIVEVEVGIRGVRDTDDLDKVSHWTRGQVTYQSYDNDVTLKQLAERRPERLRPGSILRPGSFYMKNGVHAALRIDTRSPYEIRDLGSGRFGLFEGEEQVDIDIHFPQAPAPLAGREEPKTSKGTPVSHFITLRGQCFHIVPVRHCEYFNTGDQCKFCNFNTSQDDARLVGLERAVTIDLDETAEAYKLLGAEVRLIEGHLEMGGFMNSEPEANIYVRLLERIANATPYKVVLTIIGEAMERKDYRRWKDAGADCVTVQKEVWDPKLFAEICPGKAKHAPHERWLEAFLDAVDTFGVGHVGGKIIGGLTLMPENGHRTWQEARDCHIEGNRWMIEHGVWAVSTPVRVPPGSVYGADRANQEKRPPAEYYLDMGIAHHEAMMETGLHAKLNRLLYSGMHGISGPYFGELTKLAVAGNSANWMAGWVPPEANWTAGFLAALESGART